MYDQIRSIELPSEAQIPVLDVTGEGWVLHIDLMVLSPLTVKKRWTKKEIVELFNNSETARQAGLEYPLKSLSSKRLDRVIGEIASLILSVNKPLQRARK